MNNVKLRKAFLVSIFFALFVAFPAVATEPVTFEGATVDEWVSFLGWLVDQSIYLGTSLYPALWAILIVSRIIGAI